jgi:hypothetical protein
MRASAAIALLSSLVLLAPATAPAATPCGDAVMGDWADGGIDGRYAPRCYGEALDGLPEDVRAYSTAADDIAQALRARIRETRGPASARRDGSAPTGRAASVPVPLVSGAVIALLLAVAAVAQLLARRLKRYRVTHRPTRPIGQW